jgi:DNA-binding transcriptional regulator YiaG
MHNEWNVVFRARIMRRGMAMPRLRTSVGFGLMPCMDEIDLLVRELQTARDLPTPEEVRGTLDRAGVSQARAAKAIPVAPSTFSRWVNGSARPTGARRTRYLELLQRLEQVAS